MPSRTKFESLAGSRWQAHAYDRVYARATATGTPRLIIAASEEGSRTLLELASVLSGPFSLLYVLVVARGGVSGRYQSPWLDRDELDAAVERFRTFLDSDGRHHLWIHSTPEAATLVYDRHNVIYAYGPLDAFVTVLQTAGYAEADSLPFPTPHAHRYHAAFDEVQTELVALPGWTFSPLRKEDE